MSEKPATIFLRDYKAPDYKIPKISLTFNLENSNTLVTSEMTVVRNSVDFVSNFELNGEQLDFISAKLNEQDLSDDSYEVKESGFTLFEPPAEFTLTITNRVNPEGNKALEGLYKSGGIFCTQNEPEGFRRITYFIDRPDIMSIYTTKIIANKNEYPILLSNGNLVESGEEGDDKHFAIWKDPFAKPAYLFALVAGDLGVISDKYITMNKREIDLFIYCDKGNEDKCHYAMESLKRSMKWDEDRFNLEYDLDRYMIVAVDSFNMGAMENKGLNIFNSNYVLADGETATDDNFMGVESVIGHEYFHNWTGNRVTCRDWFQLTLKEGLTVFRDQEFSSDLHSRAVERIDNATSISSRQFIEDSGPNSHPIRPSSYIEINNFYTMTVYYKGSEIIRMIHTILGEERFQKGMKRYFELFDGKAVTTDDFIYAMSNTNSFDFEHFCNWYSQSGTPEIDVELDYDQDNKIVKLFIVQSCPPTKDQSEKAPFLFPLKIGLMDQSGKDIELELINDHNGTRYRKEDGVLFIKKREELFEFANIKSLPVISINRDFSAPIRVNYDYSSKELAFIAANDSNEFSRFNAIKKLAINEINKIMKEGNSSCEWSVDSEYLKAYKVLLIDSKIDLSFKARALSLPSLDELLNEQEVLKVDETYNARTLLKKLLSSSLEDEILAMYKELATPVKYKFCKEQVGRRAVKGVLLGLITANDEEAAAKLATLLLDSSDNMTDEIDGLETLALTHSSLKEVGFAKFYDKWKENTLVMQKWLAIQTSAPLENSLEIVKKLEKDSVYDPSVPNLLRSVVGVFSRNSFAFHKKDGSGYEFIADRIIEIDKINPSMASGLCGSFVLFSKLPEDQKKLAKIQLERIMNSEGLSKNSYEIVSKTLGV